MMRLKIALNQIIILVLCSLYNLCKSEESVLMMCPKTFTFLHNDNNSIRICVKDQGETTYFDHVNDCPWNFMPLAFDNLYKFFVDDMRVYNLNRAYWTNRMREYEEGPFMLKNSFVSDDFGLNVLMENDPMNESKMCAVFNVSSRTYHAVDCKESYYSVCSISLSMGFVATDSYNMCPSQSLQFGPPFATCLKHIKFKHETDHAGYTSSEAADICRNDSGYLLQRGYIYTNYFESEDDGVSLIAEYPVGIIGGKDGGHWQLIPYSNYSKVPRLNWSDTNELSSISLQGTTFNVRGKNHRFKNFICEYPPKLPNLVRLSIEKVPDTSNTSFKEILILELRGDFDPKVSLIDCFTDSKTFYREYVKIKYISENECKTINISSISSFYFVDGTDDGYYWCSFTSPYFTNIIESNKVLFLPNRNKLDNVKAYLLQFPEHDNGKNMRDVIETYFPSAKYKRVYQNRSILIHSQPPTTTTQHGYIVLYERNLQSCGELPHIEINNVSSYYTCKGDYNTGVYWEYTGTIDTATDYNSTKFTTDNTTPIFSEKIESVISSFNAMLESPVLPETLEIAVNEMNVLLLEDIQLPKMLAKTFDDILDEVEIPQDKTYIKVVQSNIAVLSVRRNGLAPIVGIKVKRIGKEGINEDTIQPLTGVDVLDPDLYDPNNDIIAMVSSNLCHASGQLSFGVYKDDVAFRTENNSSWQVNSRVVSISLGKKNCFKKMDYVDIHFRPFDNRQSNKKKACAIWDFDNGNWSTNFCILLPSEKLRPIDICRCYHLTHFAQIIRYEDTEIEKYHGRVLSIIIYIGCTLSLIGLIIICLTGVISHEWRAEFSNKVWLNWSISTGLLNIAFLIVSLMDFTKFHELVCVSSGVILHFAVLSSFAWMFLSAFMSYKTIKRVIVKDVSHHTLLKVCIFGWIVPVLPIVILLATDPDTYLLYYKQAKTQMNFCYPSGLGYWLTVFLPVAAIIFGNTILYCMIIYNIFKRPNIASHGDDKQLFRKVSMTFLMFFLYGLILIFGLFSNNIYIFYVFCFTATVQGFILFVFCIIVNKKTRAIWYKYLWGKDKNIPKNSEPLLTTSSPIDKNINMVNLKTSTKVAD